MRSLFLNHAGMSAHHAGVAASNQWARAKSCFHADKLAYLRKRQALSNPLPFGFPSCNVWFCRVEVWRAEFWELKLRYMADNKDMLAKAHSAMTSRVLQLEDKVAASQHDEARRKLHQQLTAMPEEQAQRCEVRAAIMSSLCAAVVFSGSSLFCSSGNTAW